MFRSTSLYCTPLFCLGFAALEAMKEKRKNEHLFILEQFQTAVSTTIENYLKLEEQCESNIIDKLAECDDRLFFWYICTYLHLLTEVSHIFETELSDDALGSYRTIDPLTEVWNRIEKQWTTTRF